MHSCIFVSAPDLSKDFVAEASKGADYLGIVENGVCGIGSPFGFEDDDLIEGRHFIVLEVETDAEVMEIFAKLQCVFTFFKAVVLADLEIFIESDVVARIVL